MTDKEKLQKEYNKIVGEQIQNNNIPTDMYPIMGDLLAVAFDYVPNKVLKRITAARKEILYLEKAMQAVGVEIKDVENNGDNISG